MELWGKLDDNENVPAHILENFPDLIEPISEFLGKDQGLVVDLANNHRDGKITDEEILSRFFDK